MNSQEKIFSLIEKEKIRQLGGLELIASENFTSEDVMKATGSILTNKYAEGYPCLLYTSPSPRDISGSRMPSSA